MQFRKPTSVSLDPETAEAASEWAKKEHVQLSSYIEQAVQMRNKWHERTEAKKVENQRDHDGRGEKAALGKPAKAKSPGGMERGLRKDDANSPRNVGKIKKKEGNRDPSISFMITNQRTETRAGCLSK